MSHKLILSLLILIMVFSVSHASAGGAFTNELDVQGMSLNFVIHESYTYYDAQSFKESLDVDGNGNVSLGEINAFRQEYVTNRTAQYLGYILIDDGNITLTPKCFDIQVSGAQGPVDMSEMYVTVTMQYDLSSSVSSGKHSIWVLGHPLIENMSISLPNGVQLVDVDGIDELRQSNRDGSVMLSGRSGIRSFMLDGRQIFEYAVMINTYRSPYIANLSVFPSF